MPRFESVVLWALFAVIVFDAALRYVFQQVGMPFLLYSKDALALLVLARFGWRIARAGKIDFVVATFIGLMAFGVVIGLISGLPLTQVLFGLKLWIMLLVGVGFAHCLPDIDKQLVGLFRILVPVVILGILLDATTALPWKGLEYETMGQSIQGSREWSTFGLPRLAGFGRASYESAAVIVALVALYLKVRLTRGRPPGILATIYDVSLIVFGFAAVLLTTSKSSILVYVVLLLIAGFLSLRTLFVQPFHILSRWALKIAVLALLAFMIIPPLVAFEWPQTVRKLLTSDDVLIQAATLSYVDRVEFMWPEAFSLLATPLQLLVGRGIGGIGAAQLYFEPTLYNAADNAAVYLLVQFGLVGVGLLSLSLVWLTVRLRFESWGDIYILLLLITVAGYGSTVNVVESSALMLTIGLLLASWRQSVRTGN